MKILISLFYRTHDVNIYILYMTDDVFIYDRKTKKKQQ